MTTIPHCELVATVGHSDVAGQSVKVGHVTSVQSYSGQSDVSGQKGVVHSSGHGVVDGQSVCE